ncbi:MAG: hypothetical protein IJ446_06365 [Oscillospiraceae bacterium]|nr:hypothetical protein [Oscillospiraceae bacterium]
MKIKRIISLGAASVAMCAFMTACGAEKLDPEDYCEVQIKGAEGYASASLQYNYSNLEFAVAACQDKNADEFDKVKAALFADTIKFEITSEKTENLENGDVIEVDVIYDKDTAKKYGFVFTKDNFKHKITGLEEAKPLDPFAGISVNYEGFSPKAEYSLDFSGCDEIVKSNIKFDYDEDKRVANGDTIEIKASVKNESALLAEGYVLGSDTTSITVAGVEEGVSIDPFEGLVLEYEGISPNAKIKYDLSGCHEFVRNNVSFSSSNKYYANGDNANISISYSESKAEENGIVFTQEEKTYAISGVSEYPDSDENVDFTSIDEEFKAMLESQMANNDYYVGSMILGRNVLTDVLSDDKYTVKEIKYVPVKKMYFKAKNPQDKSTKNNHLVIWEIQMTAEKTAFTESRWDTSDDLDIGTKTTITYLAITYVQNIAVNADGTFNMENAGRNYYEIYNKSAYGKRYNNEVMSVTPDSLCEKWRSSNASDFNIIISDY